MSFALTQPGFAPRPAPNMARRVEAFAPQTDDRYQSVKRWIWVYFWLLVFEGVLRKWVFPGYSKPLLVIRDPVVLLIYWAAIRERVFPLNGWTIVLFGYAVAGGALGMAQVFTFQAHPIVVAYGWRCLFLHFPLIFVMPRVLSFDDLHKLGRWILMLSIPMTILMVIQFLMPAEHWLNVSAIEGRAMIGAAVGHVRPPGTFSFVTGPAAFYPWVIAFSFAALNWKDAYPFWLRLGAALSAILVLPVSGSRLLVASCLIVFLVALSGFTRSDQIRRVLTFMVVVSALSLPILSLTPLFNASLEAFQERWAAAAETEGQGRGGLYGMANRTANDLTGFIDVIPDAQFLGAGLGAGSNVGAALMRDTVGFGLAEAEWPRLVQEAGPIFGLSLIFLRIGLTFSIFWGAWRAFQNSDNTLAWLMFAACGPLVLYGQTAQPTALGFLVFGAGLCLTAVHNNIPMLQAMRPARAW